MDPQQLDNGGIESTTQAQGGLVGATMMGNDQPRHETRHETTRNHTLNSQTIAEEECNDPSTVHMNFEGMRHLTSSVALAVAEAMRSKGSEKLHHHTEDTILKTLGIFPGSGKDVEKVRWVIKLERVLKANRITNKQDVLRILHRAIIDPEVTDKLNEAFPEANANIFVNKDERPFYWRYNWNYPIYGDTGDIHTWAARFILAQSVNQDVIKDIVSNLTPTKQQPEESYDQLSKRIKTLKAMASCGNEIFPGEHKFQRPEMYDHYLLYDLQPELDDQIKQFLDAELRNREYIREVMTINGGTVPPDNAPRDHERIQVVRSVANRSRKKAEHESVSTTPVLIEYVYNYTGDDSFEDFKFKQGAKNIDELKLLKTRVENQSALIQEKDNQLNELRTRANANTNFYNDNVKQGGNPQNNISCFRCQGNHYVANCPEPDLRPGANNGLRRPFANNTGPYQRPNPICGNCRAQGHTAKQCNIPPTRPCRNCNGAHFDFQCHFGRYNNRLPVQQYLPNFANMPGISFGRNHSLNQFQNVMGLPATHMGLPQNSIQGNFHNTQYAPQSTNHLVNQQAPIPTTTQQQLQGNVQLPQITYPHQHLVYAQQTTGQSQFVQPNSGAQHITNGNNDVANNAMLLNSSTTTQEDAKFEAAHREGEELKREPRVQFTLLNEKIREIE